ncbi:MAG: FecR domain-containing protein [Candidatus Kerfeldbacteria bacterium]|nr:FecR domain-containing protein [Candidatus Kerfeldbacteria bacterium]
MQRNYFVISIVLLIVIGVILGGVYWYTQNNGFIDPALLSFGESNKPVAATLAYQQGTVLVRVDGADWATVETDTILHAGDQVSTGIDSKAIIEFENGDVMRLGYTTEVVLTELGTNRMIITQQNGATYHRVAKNPNRTYSVSSDDMLVSALGTAFDVIDSGDTKTVGVIESSVVVDTDLDNEQVPEGSKALITETSDDISVAEIDADSLQSDWYTWNKEEDSKKTDDLGAFEPYAGPTLTITEPTTPLVTSTTSVQVVGTVSSDATGVTINGTAVALAELSFAHTVSLMAGKNVIEVIATDAAGDRTVKELLVTVPSETQATPLILTGETTTTGVSLKWNRSTSSSFSQYKVVRSTTEAEPVYPGADVIAALRSGEERFTDTSGSAETSYYYRVCELMSDDAIFCSNVIFMRGKAAAAEEEEADEERVGIFLSGTAGSTGITLKWIVENITVTNGFKVIRSDKENPSYPGDTAERVSDSAVRSYTWTLTDGKTYHFRVCQYTENGCTVYSNDVAVTATAPTTSDSVSITMSAKAQENGVGLWWTDASDITGFKYYKVVRSETDADLRYPDDGYIAAKSDDELSHLDYSAKKGKAYYYRICAVGNEIYCSNVVRVTAIHINAAPVAVSLTAVVDGGAVVLSWTQSNEADFSAYKIVWSQTDSTPTYPDSSYLKAISDKSERSYSDTGAVVGQRSAAVTITSGTHYYSVCVLDSQGQVACSNTVTVIAGVVQ